MSQSITDFLSSLKLGDPQHCENLAMVPIFQSEGANFDYVTLEDGLEQELFHVEELEDGASVNDIQIDNRSDFYALLFEGEEFIGAKQNRILNVSVLVKPRTKQVLPVSCVEHGRWHHRHERREDRRFSLAKDRLHYARGRAMENRAVNENIRYSRVARGNQRGVWHDIEMKSSRMNAESPTAASDQMYVSSGARSRKHVNSFKHQKKQIGSVFLVDGEVSGIDLYASETTHERMLPRVVRSYSLDAIDSLAGAQYTGEADPTTAKAAAQAFVQRLMKAAASPFDGLAEGQNMRFDAADLTGSALVYEGRVLHLSAFNG